MPFIIKITKKLEGNAPDYVKLALIGIEVEADYPPMFSLMYDSTYLGNGLESSIDCCVSAGDACVGLLGAKRIQAARWFVKLLVPVGTFAIALSSDECELVRHL